MKTRYTKIPAFTLSEMIVTLLITTIVVGMAFAVLNLVQRQMLGIEQNYERNTELNRLRQSLWIDFNCSEIVFYNSKTGELSFENGLGIEKYEIRENEIVKNRDTFRLKWDQQHFLFESIEKTSGEIDAINFQTAKIHGEKQLFVYKNNSAFTYMQ